jgi:hypothetical protein
VLDVRRARWPSTSSMKASTQPVYCVAGSAQLHSSIQLSVEQPSEGQHSWQMSMNQRCSKEAVKQLFADFLVLHHQRWCMRTELIDGQKPD